MIYTLLCALASGLYTIIWAAWSIEKGLISFMMRSCLMVIHLLCHPITLIPMLLGIYFLRCYFRAVMAAAGRNAGFAPRYRGYGQLDDLSPRSSGSCSSISSTGEPYDDDIDIEQIEL